jgi:hypothetical protein
VCIQSLIFHRVGHLSSLLWCGRGSLYWTALLYTGQGANLQCAVSGDDTSSKREHVVVIYIFHGSAFVYLASLLLVWVNWDTGVMAPCVSPAGRLEVQFAATFSRRHHLPLVYKCTAIVRLTLASVELNSLDGSHCRSYIWRNSR